MLNPFNCVSVIIWAFIENEDKLLWNPHLLSEQDSEEYLAKSQHDNIQGSNGVANLPLGAHIRDDEQVSRLVFINKHEKLGSSRKFFATLYTQSFLT